MAELKTSIILDLVDRISRPVRRIEQRFGRLANSRGMRRLRSSAGRVSDTFGTAVGRAGRLAGRLTLAGGAAAGAAWGFERLVGGVTETAEAALQAGNRLGTGVRWLQRWMGVGRRFGVENNAIIDGLKEMSLRADEAAQTGQGESVDSFKRLGFSREELARVSNDTEALFDMVRKRIRDIEGVGARQRIVDEIFGGQGGEQMVEMLGASRRELRAMMREVRESGGIFGRDQAEEARTYNRRMTSLWETLQGLRRTVVIELVPGLTDAVDRFRDWVRVQRSDITANIVSGLRQFWDVLQGIGATIRWASDLLGGWKVTLALVGAIVAGPLIASIVSFGAAIVALGVAIGFTPIGWFLGIVTALAAAATTVYKNWDDIAGFFERRISKVRKAFDQGLVQGVLTALSEWNPVALVMDAVNGIVEAVTGVNLAQVGENLIQGLWDGITAKWRAMTAWLQRKVEGLTSWLPDWFTTDRESASFGPGPARHRGSNLLGEEGGAGAAAGMSPTARVGGELRISIDDEGRARVRELRRDGDMDIDVDTGMGFGGLMP